MIEPYPIEYEFARKWKNEGGAIIKNDGTVFRRYNGNTERTGITEADSYLARRKIFTHSHPRSDCFSIRDVAWACDWQVRAMRVVTHSTRKVFSISPERRWYREMWDEVFSVKIDKLFYELTGLRFDSNKTTTCEDCVDCHFCGADQWAACIEYYDNVVDFWYKFADVCGLKLEECAL